MSLGVIVLLIVFWFRWQPELCSLLKIVLWGLKCGWGGRAGNWLLFEMLAVNPGWQSSCYHKNVLETRAERDEYEARRELAISLSGLAIGSAPCFAIAEWGECQFSTNGREKKLWPWLRRLWPVGSLWIILSLWNCENPWTELAILTSNSTVLPSVGVTAASQKYQQAQ